MILDRISRLLLLVLVASLPFEFRSTLLGLSNLQWICVATLAAAAPRSLGTFDSWFRDRLVVAGGVFALVAWISAGFANEFQDNAIKGAIRITVGVCLLVVARNCEEPVRLLRVWCVSATLAALYAVAEHWDLVSAGLFRSEDFFVGTAARLSGSFEYPNTAAAYFAISLPLVWSMTANGPLRLSSSAMLWTTLLWTYSRGALASALAVGAVYILGKRPPWRLLLACAAGGVVILAVVVLSNPWATIRFTSFGSEQPLSVEYELEFTGLSQTPNAEDHMRLSLTNNGQLEWPVEGPDRVVLAYRWYDVPADRLLDEPSIETEFETRVEPGERRVVEARFVTPSAPGSYLLLWDLKSGDEWFSRLRVAPSFLEVDVRPDAVRTVDRRDLSHWVPDSDPVLDASVSRWTLWNIAAELVLQYPVFGVGPDNFRLLYGRLLGYTRWDTNVRSNSLYLEILATCGTLGLLAFIGCIGSIGWNRGAVSMALGVFLLHGVVDTFLMTTPIYFGFWILAGLSRRPGLAADSPRRPPSDGY